MGLQLAIPAHSLAVCLPSGLHFTMSRAHNDTGVVSITCDVFTGLSTIATDDLFLLLLLLLSFPFLFFFYNTQLSGSWIVSGIYNITTSQRLDTHYFTISTTTTRLAGHSGELRAWAERT